MKPKLIIAGGSGFLGQVLAKHFVELGGEVVVLTRRPSARSNGARDVLWDGEICGEWVRELEGARALVNLAGVSVNCRYHARNRKRILDSRTNSTRVLGEAISHCTNPPQVWLNSSTATIYKHNYGPAWDESGAIGDTPEAKDEFSVEVAVAWEHVFNEAATPRTRKVILRSAMVLGLGANSVFPVLCRLVKFGLGGRLDHGRQCVSWIHERDFCRAIEWLIHHEDANGVYNLAAPHPLTNAEFMRTLRHACGRRFGLPASRWMLEVGALALRTETELLIKSRHVIPGRLSANGFGFNYPTLEAASAELLERAS